VVEGVETVEADGGARWGHVEGVEAAHDTPDCVAVFRYSDLRKQTNFGLWVDLESALCVMSSLSATWTAGPGREIRRVRDSRAPLRFSRPVGCDSHLAQAR